MNLYGRRVSPFYEMVLQQVKMKGLENTIKFGIPIPGNDIKSDEYLALNPMGKIPVLHDGDFALFESGAIAEYLEDKFPKPATFSPDIEARARGRAIARLADFEIFPSTVKIFPEVYKKEKNIALIKEHVENIEKVLNAIEHLSSSEGPSIIGGEYNFTDMNLMAHFFLADKVFPAFDHSLTEGRPNLERWYKGISETEMFKKSTMARDKDLLALQADRRAKAKQE